ncbi:alpha/beta hydrolase [Actinomadura sp. NBRC 104425]|uniref:alpha/beta hydrolase n=1 Tax=Actinomadura sp. NBRC 104425 TaxID=3032204 RepID=UPI0024A06AEF|nr:alpha/beta hydrolase [Actinomadura sp. NBRC 104425]GLZ10224.1 alpha/beta hydrolase [Actinomadura sp. NBRC 104425]
MALDPQIQAVLDDLAATPAPAPNTLTVAENRAAGRAFASFAGDVVPVREVRDTAFRNGDHDVPVRIYTPETVPVGSLAPVTVFFHGGGWVFGDLDSQDHYARVVATRSKTIVVSVDYRLAPEHRFPGAVEDAYAALQWVARNASSFGADPQRIALFGESAGGNLAAVTAQEAKRRGGPAVTFQALAYPATDRFDDSPSMYDHAAGPLLTRPWLEWFWGAYLNTPDEGADPRVSPLRERDLTGLPAAFIVTAEYDLLRDQGIRYADALRAAGVPVTHRPVAGVPHAFLSFTRDVQVARDVLNEIGDAIGAAFA